MHRSAHEICGMLSDIWKGGVRENLIKLPQRLTLHKRKILMEKFAIHEKESNRNFYKLKKYSSDIGRAQRKKYYIDF
jgi:hypothetical protein